MTTEKTKNNFWTGLIAGTIISILTSVITIYFQHSLTVKEKTLQLYLDEKKDFVLACDDYLKEYRQWHELMNYLVYEDTIKNSELSEFKNFESATKAYIEWKKDIDFAYGKIFMLSDNEFGINTLKVSTVLHNSLRDVFENKYDLEKKQSILRQVDHYFFQNWLQKAQEEIFRFNSGNRKQKSMNDFFKEQRGLIKQDSLNSEMYKSLSKTHNYLTKKDSIIGREAKSRMPTRDEFNYLVNPKSNAR